MEGMMDSDAQQHFSEVKTRVHEDCAPVWVTRQSGKAVLPGACNVLKKMAYLLCSTKNAKKFSAAT